MQCKYSIIKNIYNNKDSDNFDKYNKNKKV